MRKAWARVSDSHSVEDVRRAIENKILRSVIVDDAKLSANEGYFLERDNIWVVFYEYRWFYSYFKK